MFFGCFVIQINQLEPFAVFYIFFFISISFSLPTGNCCFSLKFGAKLLKIFLPNPFSDSGLISLNPQLQATLFLHYYSYVASKHFAQLVSKNITSIKQKYLLVPASQVIPAMRIVLNLDSRGLRGLIMALYLDINIISVWFWTVLL